MFTGLIEEIGTVAALEPQEGSVNLTINCTKVMEDLNHGDSISVNGTCLTATHIGSSSFAATASPETLTITTLGNLTIGQHVNLERSLTLQSRLGGHMVQGHVDGTATVESVVHEGESQRWHFSLSPEMLKYMIHKGSVTINGVSLTIAGLTNNGFSVALIPKTLELTTFQYLSVGDHVNIEVDMISKYVYKFMETRELPF
jgi:riboflavin synthase